MMNIILVYIDYLYYQVLIDHNYFYPNKIFHYLRFYKMYDMYHIQ